MPTTAGFRVKVLISVLACVGALATLKPSDYAIHGLEALGADADDVMYSGLVSEQHLIHSKLNFALRNFFYQRF